MKGRIVNFRRSRHTTSNNQMVVDCGLDSREKAEKLVGKKVVFKTETGKEVPGEVRSAHGNSGALRVRFENGMPGQSLGQEVDIN